MAPKRGLPRTRREAERQIRDGVAALAALEEAETYKARVMATEPPNRSMVQFDGTYVEGGATYSFVAIRADHYRGTRRWFVSQNNIMNQRRPIVLPSPATWVDIVEFAVVESIYRLNRGNRVGVPNVSVGDAPLRPGLYTMTTEEMTALLGGQFPGSIDIKS